MLEPASTFLGPWTNFYMMLGGAAAALTGLLFVVITLIMEPRRVEPLREGISAYTTPTVVHFGAALLCSAIGIAPWHTTSGPTIILALLGVAGASYVLSLFVRQLRLESYQPDAEDRVWFTALPVLAYGAIFVGALLLHAVPTPSLFAIAGGAVLLIFVGIHNAWDIVTFLALGGPQEAEPRDSG